ncbi:GTPase domain-containing protein [Gordonia sp. 'Campus']|uniref:GTPase domain-containing protein n=1 Tax=Gordonia sp. 'Campus' TaxID=2915824 RepID=UPI001EE47528|nr:GTPase domain-containing protein [Gordonia sp. 'Campus']
MSDFDVQAAKKWLDEVPGRPLTDDFERQWEQFASEPKPVLTVFGSYDTGKSSLIRRLLVDARQEVPDWLTISARHETFEVRSVDLAGCVVRDTPGLAVGAQDVRGEANTRLAKDAIGLTDITIVTVTPQLATGEQDLIRALIDRQSSTEAVWFVISRFDEAGRDPDSDLDGYRDLAQRKVAELRESLGLDADTPVFVVAQDAFQFAGADRDVERDIWDDSREWDGIDGLTAAVERVGQEGARPLRTATAQRFWTQVVASTKEDLIHQLRELEAPAAAAVDAASRRDQWKTALAAADSAARARLEGVIQQAIRLAAVNHDSTQDQIASAIKSSLDEWYQEVGQAVDLLLQDLARSADRQRTEPSWQRLDAFVAAAVRDGQSDGADVTRFGPVLAKMGPKLMSSLIEIDRLNQKRLKKKVDEGAARVVDGWSQGDKEKAAKMVLSIAIAVANLIDNYRSKRATVNQARALGDQLRADATSVALAEWQSIVDQAYEAIEEATAEAGLAPILSDEAEAIRTAIDSAPLGDV